MTRKLWLCEDDDDDDDGDGGCDNDVVSATIPKVIAERHKA